MDDDDACLSRCVGDLGAFAENHWGRAPLLRRGAGPFTDLLDLGGVDDLLCSTARRPTFRVVQGGVTVPEAQVTTSVRLGGTTVADAADVGRIGGLVADGATLVLQGLQRTWLPVARFCRSLERATSHAVQANAYLTPPGAAGLGRHADTHDVLVLQLVGSKAWEADGVGAVTLEPGDVLYLPAGTAHAAAAQDEPSLHLTIGLLRDTYRGVVERALADLDLLDAPLPLGFARELGAAGLAEALRSVLEAAAEHLDKVDVGGLAAAEAGRARRRRRPLLTGQLASVLTPIDDATVVACRPENPAALEEHEDGGDVRLVDRTVHVPPQAVAAVRTLLRSGTTTVGALPGLDSRGRGVLVRRLIREGLLEVVPPG